ncbi:MAG: HD-GYP domain-containing protein [Planctomycetota bacterium]
MACTLTVSDTKPPAEKAPIDGAASTPSLGDTGSSSASATPTTVVEQLRLLEHSFGQSFAVLDLAAGRLEGVSPDWLPVNLFDRVGLCEEVARRGRPEILEDCAPLMLLGIPLPSEDESWSLLAVSTFVTTPVTDSGQLAAASKALGVGVDQATEWAGRRQVWPPSGLMALATQWQRASCAEAQNAQLKDQLTDVSAHLLHTFEELNLLHRLSERLSLSSSQKELCEVSLTWLAEVIPAQSLVVMLNAPNAGRVAVGEPTNEVMLLGEPLLSDTEYGEFVDRLGPEAPFRPLVLNRDKTSSPTWCYPSVHDLISVPIRSNNKVFGWLLALNFKAGDNATDTEFGSIEASLLSSVAAILGIHSGNIELYQEQHEFFESVILALSSSIDAKDPYTCGHSDRVARIAVCLARNLGCSTEELNTIYLSGLLHDIGKIGIDDNVLRKPGRLTKEEYEHIKTHPELGHRILAGVKQLDKVLPVVLHHHEAWDGGGYPAGLVGEECPRLARIVAVADSIDAMGSDRPYRKGMPAEKLDAILEAGAGRQWDPEVVDSYRKVRGEVRDITSTDRVPLALDVGKWLGGPTPEAASTED